MKKSFITALAAVALSLTASAYDIKVDGIYYNVIDGAYLEVTGMEDYDVQFSPGWGAPSVNKAITPEDPLPDNDYAGDIVIPAYVYVDSIGQELPVTRIRKTSFYGALKLESVTLPHTIRRIGEGAFAYSGIKSLDMGKCCILDELPDRLCMNTGLEEVIFPEDFYIIGIFAFQGCNFESIKLPDTVTIIGERAFYDCRNLKEFEGRNIRDYGNWAFCHTKLERVILYDCFETPGVSTFMYIPTLKEVISYKIDPDAFYYQPMVFVMFDGYDNLILWVPDESLEAYRKSDQWYSRFSEIRPLSERTLEPEVAADAVAETVEYYDLQGRLVANPGVGLYIRKSIAAGGSVTTEKVQMCK